MHLNNTKYNFLFLLVLDPDEVNYGKYEDDDSGVFTQTQTDILQKIAKNLHPLKTRFDDRVFAVSIIHLVEFCNCFYFW